MSLDRSAPDVLDGNNHTIRSQLISAELDGCEHFFCLSLEIWVHVVSLTTLINLLFSSSKRKTLKSAEPYHLQTLQQFWDLRPRSFPLLRLHRGLMWPWISNRIKQLCRECKKKCEKRAQWKTLKDEDTGQSGAAGSCLVGGLHTEAWPGCSPCPPYSEMQKRKPRQFRQADSCNYKRFLHSLHLHSARLTRLHRRTSQTCWLNWEEGDKRRDDSRSGGDGVGIISHSELTRHWKRWFTILCKTLFPSHLADG